MHETTDILKRASPRMTGTSFCFLLSLPLLMVVGKTVYVGIFPFRHVVPAVPATKLSDLWSQAEEVDVIGVDEGQFVSKFLLPLSVALFLEEMNKLCC